jgi:hypothetical protein
VIAWKAAASEAQAEKQEVNNPYISAEFLLT